MQFLKENKKLIFAIFLLPVFLFYLDGHLNGWIRDFGEKRLYINSLLDSVDHLINFLSHGTTLLAIACALLLCGKLFNKRLYEVGKSLVISFVFSGVIVQILKHIAGRGRPRLLDNLDFIGPTLKSGYDSFPSGHTAVAFCMAYVLAQHFPKYKVIFYLFAGIVGFERFEDAAHFPSDVLAGAILGVIVAKLLSIKIINYVSQQNAGDTNPAT